MTRRELFRAIIAFGWLKATADLVGFRFLLPGGWKRRYPPMGQFDRIAINAMNDILREHALMQSFLGNDHFLKYGCAVGTGYMSGGTYIAEPIIYG